jgi:antitoxin component YwqK of YwqJK toxin-antitoxin module
VDGKADGYWEWYRLEGKRKRLGFFKDGEPVGEWITYDKNGSVYKVSEKNSR